MEIAEIGYYRDCLLEANSQQDPSFMSFRKACHLGVLSAKEAKIMIPHSVLSYTDPKVSIYAIFYGKNPRMSVCSLWEDIFSNHPKS